MCHLKYDVIFYVNNCYALNSIFVIYRFNTHLFKLNVQSEKHYSLQWYDMVRSSDINRIYIYGNNQFLLINF
jgi:hypothetical protein